jgi:hypothetical protein
MLVDLRSTAAVPAVPCGGTDFPHGGSRPPFPLAPHPPMRAPPACVPGFELPRVYQPFGSPSPPPRSRAYSAPGAVLLSE